MPTKYVNTMKESSKACNVRHEELLLCFIVQKRHPVSTMNLVVNPLEVQHEVCSLYGHPDVAISICGYVSLG
jgi:hypothetical protein